MAADRLRLRAALTALFLLYAGLQLYGVAKVHAALALGGPLTTALVAWVAVMTVMPLLIWQWEQRGWHRAVLVGSWIGYLWMGVAWLFFWIALALDLLGVLLSVGGPSSLWSARDQFLLACSLTVAISIHGIVAARRVRVERVVLSSLKLAGGDLPIRIALISDLHLGALIGAGRLRALVEQLRRLDPDVLMSAGDLVDGQANQLNGLAPMLAAFRPRLGKFAVTGNHEYFVGLDRALDFHRRAGFTLLRGNAADLTGSVTVAGVDDPTGVSLGASTHLDEPAALGAPDRSRFTILLKHQPRRDPRVAGRVDLQLSGHVHRGQIFPFGLLVRLSYPLPTGLTRFTDDTWLYVSRGTGTWGPPLRVLAPSEITLIELRPAAPASRSPGSAAAR